MANNVNWEKIGIYFAVMVSFVTVIFYMADMKERIAKLEVKVEYLEKNKQRGQMNKEKDPPPFDEEELDPNDDFDYIR